VLSFFYFIRSISAAEGVAAAEALCCAFKLSLNLLAVTDKLNGM
jgi:hypothetical protein